MKNLIFSFLTSLCLMATLSGCLVSRKKLDKMTALKLKCDSTYNDLLKRNNALQKEAANLRTDTSSLGKNGRSLASQLKTLNDNYNTLLNASSKDAASMASKINKLSDDLQKREARVAELESVLAAKEKAVKDLKAKVQDALLSFKEKDLTVNVKNGKVYVSLSEQLLFKSGSYAVDPRGIEAIKKLANVLIDNPDISVTVEGHTDDVKMLGNTAGMKDNWDLSVLRATSICRELTGAGVQGAHLIASGRSEYLPIENAKTPEARQKNRRTEIILTPKLDELFNILGQ